MSISEDYSLPAFAARSIAARGDVITEADSAMVQVALLVAYQLEKEFLAGGERATKAVYMVPHFKNLMTDFGCLPAARAELDALLKRLKETGSEPGPEDKEVKNEIAARRARLRGRGA